MADEARPVTTDVFTVFVGGCGERHRAVDERLREGGKTFGELRAAQAQHAEQLAEIRGAVGGIVRLFALVAALATIAGLGVSIWTATRVADRPAPAAAAPANP